MNAGRRARGAVGAILLTLVLAAVSTAAYLLRDPLPRFLERRGAVAAVAAAAPASEGGYSLRPVRVTATTGLSVDLVVRRWEGDGARRLPLAVVLGGHYRGSDAARLLGDTRGVEVAALSYPFAGDPRPDAMTFVRQIPRIRAAFLDTPPAVMLGLDYLLGRGDVDTSQVEAVGVSLGAPFMTIAGAIDPRFTRVWAIHGSGGSFAPLEANMRRAIPIAPLRVAVAALANLVIAGPRLDPMRWAPLVSPRPFMMVNAENDERLPREAVDALYASARQPKELIWMSGRHVHGDTETIRRLVAIVVARMNPTILPAGR